MAARCRLSLARALEQFLEKKVEKRVSRVFFYDEFAARAEQRSRPSYEVYFRWRTQEDGATLARMLPLLRDAQLAKAIEGLAAAMEAGMHQ